jgi:FAD dependent oxidoreductase
MVEQDLSPEVRPDGPVKYPDSVGVGAYRIDLHPSTRGRNYIDVPSYPFQVPLGSLIPVRVDNLLAAAKNIGTTHVTNGCYRLHPVEWNVGEAAGSLAAYCIEKRLIPRQVRNDPSHLSDFQRVLEDQGFELDWPHLRPL